ncbi:homoserine dehydrogenase [Methanococcus voltae]|uniref:Homoserine dehydrogenase n=2 Tax=Methanococcus voltae TaxID=2188 RepID=A0A8J7UQC4_METVO|nr:homoserine dehydrogenase [Methanococcus voltae]MBP2172331.1 homoserine dehydrogenase [Methanococcus voltae]MBP2200713.1 homoserine dehydrogenase [Methanococcus voltae]MCS3921437.1 homoserine dehydrogenase [Methanococcus voltae PS]
MCEKSLNKCNDFKELKVILVGLGVIGKGVLKVIDAKNDDLFKKYGFKISVVAACDSSGATINENGIKPLSIIKTKEETGKIVNHDFGVQKNILEVIESVNADVVIEVTPTNIETGEPAKSYTLKAFETKKHVVSANKGALAVAYSELMNSADKNDVMFRYEASVGGAMPVINLARESLAGNNIKNIKGILNGTTNYILTKMEKEGLDFNTILKEAQELGIAETNPHQDVSGLDTAAKMVILANTLLGKDYTIKDVKLEGITRITPEALEMANKSGTTIKLIGEVSNKKLEVCPKLIPIDHPMNVKGSLNVAMFDTDLAKDVVVIGRGAGDIETSSAILSDLIFIGNSKKCND